MIQPISTAKAEKNRNATKKSKGNRNAAIPSFVQQSQPGIALSQELARRGNHNNDLFLEYYCLFKIASSLSDHMDAEHTLTIVKKLIRQNFPFDQYSLMLLDENGQDLVIKSHFGFSRKATPPARFSNDGDVFGAALKRKRPVYVPDIARASSQYRYHTKRRRKSGAFLSLPLISENGRPVGVMNLFRREANSFSIKEIDLLRKIAAQVGRVIDTIAIYHHTRELSITDELTKIFNRRYFNQRYEREVQRAQRYGRALSLIMLDIDHFKVFNDTHGHLLGDAVLKQVAKILEENLRKADILARFGGEEFVILLPEIDKEHGQKVAEKLRRAIERSNFPKAETQPLGRLTVSLGLASFLEDAKDANELIARADQGLYWAKSHGRNQVGVYQEAIVKYPRRDRMKEVIYAKAEL